MGWETTLVYRLKEVIRITLQDQLIDKAKQLTDCSQGLVNQHINIGQVQAQLADAQVVLQKMHNDLQSLLNTYHDLLVMSNTQQDDQSAMRLDPVQKSIANAETVKSLAVPIDTKG